MAQNSSPKPKTPAYREQIQVKIRPEVRARLDQEADERMIARNLLVERALEDLFAKFDKQ